VRFGLIDHILELTRGERIVAVKAVSMAEEYLADHFPTFPVLPGVLILQAFVESATWLVRDAQDFPPRCFLLRNVKNITYKSFVRPGKLLRLEVSCRRLARDDSDFEGVGYCQDEEIARGRFGLVHVDVTGGVREPADVGDRMADESRKMFELLR